MNFLLKLKKQQKTMVQFDNHVIATNKLANLTSSTVEYPGIRKQLHGFQTQGKDKLNS
jgi:hypothetical protein